MHTEYEAMFTGISPDDIRMKMEALGWVCVKPEFTQRRTTFYLPKWSELTQAYLRVRDESDRITLSLKMMWDGEGIDSQKEVELVVNSYADAVLLHESLGAVQKAQQETRREIWEYNGVQVMIDWWPFLDPVVEIEGIDESSVCRVSQELWFDWSDAIFDSIDVVYSEVYGVSRDRVNNETPKIVFDMNNPFL